MRYTVSVSSSYKKIKKTVADYTLPKKKKWTKPGTKPTCLSAEAVRDAQQTPLSPMGRAAAGLPK